VRYNASAVKSDSTSSVVHFFKVEGFLFKKHYSKLCSRGVVNFYNAGIVAHEGAEEGVVGPRHGSHARVRVVQRVLALAAPLCRALRHVGRVWAFWSRCYNAYNIFAGKMEILTQNSATCVKDLPFFIFIIYADC
jgi:hypothetical protein